MIFLQSQNAVFVTVIKHKTMKQTYIFLLVVIAFITSIWACGGKEKGDTALQDSIARADSMALKVGVLPTLDCLPLYIAAEEGIFDSIGVDVRLVNYDNSFDSDNAIMTGTIDGGVTDCVRAQWMKARGCAVKPVSVTNTYWQFITNSKARISKFSQMTDKMIAMTRFSATAMMADMAVDSSGIDDIFIFLIQINNPQTRLRMIQNNEMDAAVMAEPQATTARSAGHPVLMDSRDRRLQLGCIVFSEKILADERKQEQVERFLRAYDAAVEEINKHGVKAYSDIITSRMNTDDETVSQLPDIVFDKHTAPSDSIMSVVAAWLDKEKKK